MAADVTVEARCRARRRSDGRARSAGSTSSSRTPASSRRGATPTDLDLDALDRTLAVNVRGVAATMKHGARALARDVAARSW